MRVMHSHVSGKKQQAQELSVPKGACFLSAFPLTFSRSSFTFHIILCLLLHSLHRRNSYSVYLSRSDASCNSFTRLYPFIPSLFSFSTKIALKSHSSHPFFFNLFFFFSCINLSVQLQSICAPCLYFSLLADSSILLPGSSKPSSLLSKL